MGLEFRIETYDTERASLPAFLKRLPEYHSEGESGEAHLSHDAKNIGLSVFFGEDGLGFDIVQHVSCRATDTLLGLIVREILSVNDSIVMHGGY